MPSLSHERSSGDARVVAALVVVQALFALHYVAAKQILEWIPAPAWAVIRISLASALLQFWCWRRGMRWPRTVREWRSLAVFAVTGVVINQLFFIEGLERTTPAHSALINTTIPVWTIAFAVLLRRESITTSRFAGLALSAIGVGWLLHADRFRLEADLLAGDLMTMVNAASYGLFLVLSRRYLQTHDPLATIAQVFTLGSIAIAIYGVGDLLAVRPLELPLSVYGWGTYTVVFATVGAHFLNFWALGRVSASVVALFIYLQPVLATVLDGLLRGEWPGAGFYWATLLVFAGVAIGSRRGAETR